MGDDMVGGEGGGPADGLGLTAGGGYWGPPCMPPGPNIGGPLLTRPPPTFAGGTGGPAKGPGRGPGVLIVEEGEGPEAMGLETNGGGGLLPGGPPPPGPRLGAMKGGNVPCGGPVGGGTAPLGTAPGGGGPGRLGPENGDENGADEGNGCWPNGGTGPLGPPPGFGG